MSAATVGQPTGSRKHPVRTPRPADTGKEATNGTRERVSLGEAIRQRRADLGISLAGALRASGLSEPTWKRIERGQADPSRVRPDTWRAMARVLRWPARFHLLIVEGKQVEDHDYPGAAFEGGDQPAMRAALHIWLDSLPGDELPEIFPAWIAWQKRRERA